MLTTDFSSYLYYCKQLLVFTVNSANKKENQIIKQINIKTKVVV